MCKIAREVKDEIRKTENTILRALCSVSESSLNSNVNDISVGTTLRDEESGQDCLELYGLDLDQENIISESVLSVQQTEIHDNDFWRTNFFKSFLNPPKICAKFCRLIENRSRGICCHLLNPFFLRHCAPSISIVFNRWSIDEFTERSSRVSISVHFFLFTYKYFIF